MRLCKPLVLEGGDHGASVSGQEWVCKGLDSYSVFHLFNKLCNAGIEKALAGLTVTPGREIIREASEICTTNAKKLTVYVPQMTAMTSSKEPIRTCIASYWIGALYATTTSIPIVRVDTLVLVGGGEELHLELFSKVSTNSSCSTLQKNSHRLQLVYYRRIYRAKH